MRWVIAATGCNMGSAVTLCVLQDLAGRWIDLVWHGRARTSGIWSAVSKGQGDGPAGLIGNRCWQHPVPLNRARVIRVIGPSTAIATLDAMVRLVASDEAPRCDMDRAMQVPP